MAEEKYTFGWYNPRRDMDLYDRLVTLIPPAIRDEVFKIIDELRSRNIPHPILKDESGETRVSDC